MITSKKTRRDYVEEDRIVVGISDRGLQERLLRITDLNVDSAVSSCRAAEVVGSRQQL